MPSPFDADEQSMTPDGRAPYPRLLGDIGGTHLRFGLALDPADGIVATRSYRWSEVAGIEGAVESYLRDQRGPAPRACALSVAAPVSGDEVRLTNRGWAFSTTDLRQRLGVERLDVLNDFTALALAVPRLRPEEARQVGAGVAVADAPIAILGPGTGLGVSASLAAPAGRLAVPSEGGHATLSASDATEDRLLSILRQWFGDVSFERVLSGDGIVNLYRAQCAMAGIEAAPHDAATISELAAQGGDASCGAAMDRFFGFLGTFAGNLALTFDARGGVFLAGGIVPRLIDRIGSSSFRRRFESKGRFRAYLERIPTKVIADPAAAALLGANQALEARR
jgi:glucokinase